MPWFNDFTSPLGRSGPRTTVGQPGTSDMALLAVLQTLFGQPQPFLGLPPSFAHPLAARNLLEAMCSVLESRGMIAPQGAMRAQCPARAPMPRASGLARTSESGETLRTLRQAPDYRYNEEHETPAFRLEQIAMRRALTSAGAVENGIQPNAEREAVARSLCERARTSGRMQFAQFENRPMVARPGDGADAVAARWRAASDVETFGEKVEADDVRLYEEARTPGCLSHGHPGSGAAKTRERAQAAWEEMGTLRKRLPENPEQHARDVVLSCFGDVLGADSEAIATRAARFAVDCGPRKRA